MPRFDKRGPRGMGPGTGRGFGPCGMGMGRGYGLGMGCFGCPGCPFGCQASVSDQKKYLKEYLGYLEEEIVNVKKVLEEQPKTA